MAHDDMLTFYAGKGLEFDALLGDGRSWCAHEPRPCERCLASCGAAMAPGGGVPAHREQDEALGLTATGKEAFSDGRSGFDRPGHGIR